MGFDLADAFNRATNQGKFGKFKQGGFADNMNIFGESSERKIADLSNPLGNKNDRTADFLKDGKLWEGWQSSMADNFIGEKFEHDALKTGASKKQAMERGTGGAGAVVGSVLAAIFSGGSSAGAQAGAGSAGTTGGAAATTGGAAGAAEGGLMSKAGSTLGFSGKGGSMAKGLGNVKAIKGLLGGGQGGQGEAPGQVQVEQDQPIGQQGGQSGFDLGGYLPQYYDGGIPNEGKPAVIYDMKTKKPTGTMNERGPETIVPAYDGRGSMSLVDDSVTVNPNANGMPQGDTVVPTQSRGLTQNEAVQASQALDMSPQEALQKGIFASAKLIGEDESAVTNLKKYRSSMTGEKGNSTKLPDQTITKIEPKGDKGFLGMGDFGNGLKEAARIYGYYTDVKRNNWGLGKSGVTRYLENMDALDSSKSSKSAKGKDYSAEKDLYKYKTDEDIRKDKAKSSTKDTKQKEETKQKDLIKFREEAMEDWDSLKQEEKDKYGDTPEGKRDYIKDRMEGLKGKAPEYKKVDTGETTKWFGRGDKILKDERTGEYVPTENGSSEVTAVGKTKSGKIKLSDGTFITQEEAKKRGLI